MATRTTKPASSTNEDIALELTKAALLGGAVQRKPFSEEAIQNNINAVNALVIQQARLDAAYMIRLYEGILGRLNKSSEQAK